MDSRAKAVLTSNQRVYVIVCVTAAAAFGLTIAYVGHHHGPVLSNLTAPIRALNDEMLDTTCAARKTKRLFEDVFQGGASEAPKRVRLLHAKEERKLKQGEIEVPPLEQLLDKMTLEEMVGQIIQPENKNAQCYEVSMNKVGSVFFGGNDNPGSDDAASWHRRANEIQKEALSTAPHHIPVFIGVDTIHGMSHMKDAAIFPHNIALGCTRNEKLVEQVGRITAEESAAVDVNWGFSPCVALATDIRWGRIYESFGQDPDLVGKMGAAYVRGGNSIKKPFVTCGKHFVGDGGTKFGTGRIGKPLDRGDWTGSMAELRATHMKPYEYLVEAGVKSIMASYSSVNGTLMHGHEYLIQKELKERMGFKGFVSSDYNAVNALNQNYNIALAKAINSGVDQIMLGPAGGDKPFPGQIRAKLMALVEHGHVSKERIRDAARRVLWAKFESGLMHQQPKTAMELSTIGLKDQLSTVGSLEHRKIARQAVQEATVILKNEAQLLPLDIKQKKVCIIGDAANDGGKMLGGWSLNWQSQSGDLDTRLTTIKDAIVQHAKTSGVPDHVTYAKVPSDCKGSDVALVVIGEDPYAEFMGDKTSMPKIFSAMFVKAIKKELKIPVALLAIPGRPVDVDGPVSEATAFAVSFVPGSEGGPGITNVLFGKVAPTGKLSLDWPKSGHALVRVAKKDTLLFEYGDGLTWKVAAAPEDAMADKEFSL